jgi:hypothetical protein
LRRAGNEEAAVAPYAPSDPLIHLDRRLRHIDATDDARRHAGGGAAGGQGSSTTLPAAILAQAPISMLPNTPAPVPSSSPRPTFGRRLRRYWRVVAEAVFREWQSLSWPVVLPTRRRRVSASTLRSTSSEYLS